MIERKGYNIIIYMEYFEINYLAVFISGVLAMIIGALWYGPLFGDTWMKIIGADKLDKEARDKMQKESGLLYLFQFVIVLLQFSALSHMFLYFGYEQDISIDLVNNFETTFYIWLFIIVPTIFGASVWNNDSKKIKTTRFLIQSGYQFIIFTIAAVLISILV